MVAAGFGPPDRPDPHAYLCRGRPQPGTQGGAQISGGWRRCGLRAWRTGSRGCAEKAVDFDQSRACHGVHNGPDRPKRENEMLRNRLLLGAGCIAVLSVVGGTAFAQEQSSTVPETVVVTGSRLGQAGLNAPTPVT